MPTVPGMRTKFCADQNAPVWFFAEWGALHKANWGLSGADRGAYQLWRNHEPWTPEFVSLDAAIEYTAALIHPPDAPVGPGTRLESVGAVTALLLLVAEAATDREHAAGIFKRHIAAQGRSRRIPMKRRK